MSTSNESNGPVVVLMFPEMNKDLLVFARAVYAGLLDNPHFPNPSPPLTVLAADIDAFADAETKAATRAKGAATFRNAKKRKLKATLSHHQDYVQSIVETNTCSADAVAMIESAFMTVKKVYKRSHPELRAKNADVSGKVALAAKRVAPTAVYHWEYSLDQSTWTPVPETMKASMVISGLASAQTYYFRFRAFTRAGWRDYSQVVSLLVH